MKVAFIGDQPGKVHFNRYQVMSKYLPIAFDFFTIKNKRLSKICAKYDAVYYASYTMFGRSPIDHPMLTGSATSWKCIFGDQHDRDMRMLNKFKRISVNNLSLHKKIVKHKQDAVYIPNGVESDFFSPSPHDLHRPIRVGWAGNSNRGEKNFRLLKSVVEKCPQVEWDIVATTKSMPAKKMRSHRQMRDYYRTLDYFLVISSYEGTPNPALEAASCGVPLITTKVGNMPELIEHGVTGWFVQNNLTNIVDTIRFLGRVHNQDHRRMSDLLRQNIVKNWDWKSSCAKFESFFRTPDGSI